MNLMNLHKLVLPLLQLKSLRPSTNVGLEFCYHTHQQSKLFSFDQHIQSNIKALQNKGPTLWASCYELFLS